MQTHAAQYEFTGRREDRRLVTGRGKYTDDWNLPGQLHAVFVRADRAHAILRAVKTDAAMRHPGVVAVVTSRDIANEGWKNPGTMVSYPGRGKPLQIPHHSMLATERVRYVGEEIAMVVAQTAAIARDAAELVEVDYQDLPAAVDVEAAMKPGAAQLYPDIVNNVCFDYDYGNEAATAEAFKAAHHITRLRAESQRISGNPMELRGAIAAHDQASDSFDLYLPHQGMTMMRGGLIGIMGLTPDKLRIRAIDVGGGFGPRSGVYAEFPVLLWAAKKLGRPIKWQSTRNEIFMTEFPGRALVLNGELALDRNGKFLAIRMQWTCDQGAYLSGAGPFINTLNAAMTITGCYTIPVAYGRHQLVLTNTVPTTAYRGAGRPDMAYIVERLVDQAATETGIDRIELRRRNAVPKAAFPYKTPCNNVEYDSGDYATLLNEAMSKCDWAGFPARRAASAAKGKLRGIGMGLFVEPAGGGMAPKDQVTLKIDKRGEIVLHAVVQSHGQSHETVYPEIVAQELGIAPERITLAVDDHAGAGMLIGNGVVGSRSTMAHGSAFKVGAIEMIKKGNELAGKKLEAAPEDIEFKDGTYSVKGTDRRVTLLALAKDHKGPGPNPLDSMGEMPLARTFPSGAHVAEVEIDPQTGTTKVLSYVAVDDAGRIINHTIVEGQIHGGIMQGAGQVFGEHVMYDLTTGQLLTGSFMDYFMPRAGLLPEIACYERSVPSPTNPLGVKGVGEAGTSGALGTLMNAVVDALRPAGINHFDMPATPARVWEALQAAKR